MRENAEAARQSVLDLSEQMLRINEAFEQELIDLYHAAARHSARIGDHDSRLFFQALHAEEKEHARHMLEWLQELQAVDTIVST